MGTLLITLGLLNAFDAVMTWYAIYVAGYAYEANPLMAWAMGHGLWAFFALKAVMLAVPSAFLWYLRDGALGRKVYNVTVALVIMFMLLADWHVFGYLTWRMR
jgi:hypothetical protein